ncbi:hypothetical protein [Hymenobacter psychrophilus]|uniref:Uncharacterized protein n=1 Tax=Hymenobacter psychrophilus TaxID=651662 RepID=A0A1H3FVS9_9BACT|nr:hypothetical protein [Hymenobacter psychrophilus]SDX95203.1 hypothetical protein SAMN04488069_104248 [Hymenobacter psychrophilus]
MGIIDNLLFALPVCLISALITVYIAHMYGRRFWPWLLFGFFVPLLSTFVAIALGIRDARRNGE